MLVSFGRVNNTINKIEIFLKKIILFRNALPFMAVDPIPEYLNCIFNCDSFTFNPIEWIDSRSNFSVNFIKDLSLVFSYSNYFPLKQSTKLSNLPLWIILQLLGTNYFSNNLSNNIQLVKKNFSVLGILTFFFLKSQNNYSLN